MSGGFRGSPMDAVEDSPDEAGAVEVNSEFPFPWLQLKNPNIFVG